MKIPVVLFLALLCARSTAAEDWPQWRGQGRLGIWNETGVVETFPAEGLEVSWRTPIHSGYAGPAVAGGRVFVTDFRPTQGNQGFERILCLDEKNGEILWQREWEVDYTGLMQSYAIGPRATPTVDGDRVYVLGAMGKLMVLKVDSGEIVWEKDFVKDFGTTVPTWGMTGAPLVDGERVICLVGGEPDGKVIAFDKLTGAEVWRALSSDWEPGYAQPIIFEIGGVRQLVIWHPQAISSLDPTTGDVHWEVPFRIQNGLTVATPIRSGPYLFVSSFYDGAHMLKLDTHRPGAELLWSSSGGSDVQTDKIHTLISTAVIDGEYLYGIDSYGQARGLAVGTGERMWESVAIIKEKARFATAFFVRNGDRYFINNDRGELIIGRFTPEGFDETSRTKLIEPTSTPGARRELGAVNWSHPAYANRHIFARNDKEILRASLAKD